MSVLHSVLRFYRRTLSQICPVFRGWITTAAILDARTLQSTPESGARAGYDGHKKRKGSKIHVAVDTLGMLLALKVTAANEQERAQVGELVEAVQKVTGNQIKIAFVDQGYTGADPAEAAAEQGVQLEVIKLQEAKRGFTGWPLPYSCSPVSFLKVPNRF